jgi:hypothetical protein
MRLFASFASALVLAGCYAQTPPPTKAPAEPPAATTPPPLDTNAITSEGWGPLRIGMTRDDVVTAMGPDANPSAMGGPDPEACDLFHPVRAPEGMFVMIQRGVLTRITLQDNMALKTDRGFGIGGSAAAIKAAYGSSARVEQHHYLGLPAEYITVWTSTGGAAPNERGWIPEDTAPNARGIRYETDVEGRVTSIHAGGPSIQYVEGCS